ncbi:hypothetical protein Drorol1_Dr00013583 [Drosera rotundifolia]
MAQNSSSSTTTTASTAVATTKLPMIKSTYDPSTTTKTTFVQTDPSNFRAIVQHLTGPTPPPRPPQPDSTVALTLHQRRQAMRKPDNIALNLNGYGSSMSMMVSPVSPLDNMGRDVMMNTSPRTPMSPPHEVLEEKAIAEKGFYLHPLSPLGTPRESQPRLLPLFPLQSPRDR